MKIVSINICNYGSTGNIMRDISKLATERGHTTYFVYPKLPNNFAKGEHDLVFNSVFNRKVNALLERFSGLQGHFAYSNTRKLIKFLSRIKPDVIHFHNIHGLKINYKKVFNFIKINNIKVVWTLHDCWTFTGGCSHFEFNKCEKWKEGCSKCAYFSESFRAKIDKTKKMWLEKRALFTGLDMTIVTPSSWLKDLVKQSFLKDYPVEVINNGIDLTIFKPTQSDFRKRFDLQDKKVILGVSFDWGDRKGLGDFVKLATTLGDDYKVILVGTDESVVAQVPKNIFCINVTQNKRELAEIYSTADVFVNPTREDTFPTVNLEALACGTPVVTYQTGGSPESITDKCGRVVPYEDYEALRDAVVEICTEQVIDRSDCVLRAQNYNKEDKFAEYVKLYDRIDA